MQKEISPNRDFKGIWIPKDIWMDQNLTCIEKLILVEIDSLDGEGGCFASNNYFGKFFGLTASRISQLISSLEKKKYISASYEYQGKEVVKRVLKILNRGGIKFSKGGIKFFDRGYLENCEDNNTVNNTINKDLSISTNKGEVGLGDGFFIKTFNFLENKIVNTSGEKLYKFNSIADRVVIEPFRKKFNNDALLFEKIQAWGLKMIDEKGFAKKDNQRQKLKGWLDKCLKEHKGVIYETLVPSEQIRDEINPETDFVTAKGWVEGLGSLRNEPKFRERIEKLVEIWGPNLLEETA